MSSIDNGNDFKVLKNKGNKSNNELLEQIASNTAGGSGPDREFVTTTYFVTNAFTGASIGDTITCTQVWDVSTDTPSLIASIWRNQTTASDLVGTPSASNLSLVGSGAATAAKQDTGNASIASLVTVQGATADAAVVAGAAGTHSGKLRAISRDIGALTETAPSSDTESAGLNGRLQRIAQRLTSLIALFPSALGQALMSASMPVAIASDQTPVSVKGQVPSASTVTISSGQSLSPSIDLGTGVLARITIPASWTTANLTFQSSSDSIAWNDLYDEYGSEVTVQVGGASRAVRLTFSDWIGHRYIKIRSGTTGTPVAQGADRILTYTTVPR